MHHAISRLKSRQERACSIGKKAASGALQIEPLDEHASAVVRELVERHAAETGSVFAKELLEHWSESAKRFTHLVPKQFVAMTAAMDKAKAEHIDFNEPGVWEETYEHVMEGAR